MRQPRVEINEQFSKALSVSEQTRKHVFITGKAGTGKSTLLKYFRETTKKKIIVLAPTGVAALNVAGETIHSFFGFKPDITPDKVKKVSAARGRIFRELDAVVIDEISMVRADILDCVDRALRLNGPDSRKPFGGIQMIFVGDLYQLPPVVAGREKHIFKTHYETPYFFSAKVFEHCSMEFVELEKIYRQKDAHFIRLLNAIRNNSVTQGDLDALNTRVGKAIAGRKGFSLHLLTTNAEAREINIEHLNRLKATIHTYQAGIDGDFSQNSYPADAELHIAKGAQVMLLNNDALGRWVNGSLGEIVAVVKGDAEGGDSVRVRLHDGCDEDVFPVTWKIFYFTWNEAARRIESDTVGTYTQYPLKLAWAVTIHKSQGKTFDRVVIDMGKGSFAHGQTYVALSRCTSLEGISLARPLRKSDVLMDWAIVRFMTRHQYNISERDMPLDKKLAMIDDAIVRGVNIEITYLKAKDEKSSRRVKPLQVGEQEYKGVRFTGLRAHCLLRKDERVFRVDRILQMKIIGKNSSF